MVYHALNMCSVELFSFGSWEPLVVYSFLGYWIFLSLTGIGSDLFAAAVPVCPSMTPETFEILKSIRRPVWVTSAYIDHSLYRHKYLVDAVMNMRDHGNREAHLTLFSPEELEKYDISITPSLKKGENYADLFHQNHWSWVPTYKNEYGIMSWLLNQTKED